MQTAPLSDLEFVDTNILIYAHDRDNPRYSAALDLFRHLVQSRRAAVSTQILTEFYSVATRKLRYSSEEASAIIDDLHEVQLHRPDHASLMRAIQLHKRHKTSWWDALVLTSALDLGCSILWTEDLNHNQRFGSLTVKNPFRK